MKNRNTILVAILPALACFAFLPRAQAITPPLAPDPGGSLPFSNTADGALALAGLTTGIYNSAFGTYSLVSNADANFNTGVGGATLLLNTGSENTAVGAGALLSNTTAGTNTAVGAFALFNNADGDSNTAVGDRALFSNNTGGTGNTAIGRSALATNQTGSSNTATGFSALINNSADANIAYGMQALFGNTDGTQNVAIGVNALSNNLHGSNNVAVGNDTGGTSTSASNVICVGALAGSHHQSGDNDLYLGNPGIDTESGTVRIGTGDNVHTRMFLAGVRDVTPDRNDGIQVYIDSGGQLGTMPSSRRFKHDIKPMDEASDAILALKPVTFHYKSDKTSKPQFGLIAEEVAEVNPDLVVRNDKGEIYTVRYDAVNAMLLNEFLKEHHKVDQLEKQVAALSAGLQKVSAQLELSKRPTRAIADRK